MYVHVSEACGSLGIHPCGNLLGALERATRGSLDLLLASLREG